MEYISREALLRKRPRRTLEVALPEFDGQTALVRELSEGERSKFEATLTDRKGAARKGAVENARRRLVLLSVIDASGNPVLTPADLDAMADVSASAVSRLFDAARELSGFAEGEIEDEVKKNAKPSSDSAKTPGESLPWVSPSPPAASTLTPASTN